MGPTEIPPEVVRRINSEVDKILRDPEFLQRIHSFGFSTSDALTPQSLTEQIKEDVLRWRRIAADIGCSRSSWEHRIEPSLWIRTASAGD